MPKIIITNWEEAWAQTMQRLAFDVETALKAKLEPGSKGYDTGELASRIKAIANPKDNSITIEMPAWGKYIEFGTPGRIAAPPGMATNPDRKYPMYKEGDEWHYYFKDWARRKLGITDEKELFPLARHMVLYGTRPFPFIRTTLHQNFIPLVRKNMKETFGQAG